LFKNLKWLITSNVSRSLSGVVHSPQMKSRMEMTPLSMSSLTGVKLLSSIPKKPDKRKEILALIWSLNPPVNKKTFSIKPPYRSFRVFSKATMVPFSLMVKPVQGRHIPCKVARLSKSKEVSFQELSSTSLSPLKVNF
jgi:hypothetical protein